MAKVSGLKCIKTIAGTCSVFICLAVYKWELLQSTPNAEYGTWNIPQLISNLYYKVKTTKQKNNPVLLSSWRSVKSVSCARIFSNDSHEIKRAKTLENDFLSVLSPIEYLDLSQNCSKFLRDRRYFTMNLSTEEVTFPIAFSIMVYKAVFQFERLLRSIYRPQNFYCVHVDFKMSDANRRAMTAIVSCFDNVFISSKSYDVRWSTITSLKADLACMNDLLSKSWKYFINLTGQEFPLKTNLEIVKILRIYNGANDLKVSRTVNWSWRWKSAGTAQTGLIPYKGRVHITVNRAFVEFAVRNKRALQLLKWLTPTKHPDETFFTTLNYNPQLGIPGAFNGKVAKVKNKRFGQSMNRYKRWAIHTRKDYRCGGKFVRNICIPGVADLPMLGKRPEMFLNKLYWDYNHYVLDCMEELIYNRTIDGFDGKLKFNGSEYSKMYFIKHSFK